jgi:hypothetical protein
MPLKEAFFGVGMLIHHLSSPMARCPPGSHPLSQGLAYIVILDFDSTVIRMMLKDKNNRFMMLRVRSER